MSMAPLWRRLPSTPDGSFEMKKIQCFAALLAVCLGLCGCMKSAGETPGNAVPTSLELCGITSSNAMVELDSGYYARFQGLLYYADKGELQHWVPVCNAPGCTHEEASCPARADNGFYLAGDRIYTLRDPSMVNPGQEECLAVYSMAMDGTDLRQEYTIAGSSMAALGGASMAILRQGEVIGSFSALQPDGMYHNQLVRTTADGESQVLFSGESADRATNFLVPASGLFGMRGDFALCSDLLSGAAEVSNHLYVPTETGFQEIPGICDYDLYGAYLAGNQLLRFVPGDGYYATDLQTGASEKRMDAQLQDSVAYHLTDQYIVETNLVHGTLPEEPEIMFYDGMDWHLVTGIPDSIKQTESDRLFPAAVSTQYIFFTVSGSQCTRLYYVSLDDPDYLMVHCGDFVFPGDDDAWGG